MGKNHEMWERLVRSVLRREELRQLAYASSSSSRSSSFSGTSSSMIDESLVYRPSYELSVPNLGASIEPTYNDIQVTGEGNPPTTTTINFAAEGDMESIFLDNETGKKCLMVGARELIIEWGDTPKYWEWTSDADSRFSEVAQLRVVFWLDIKCKIRSQMLSRKTLYGAYMVFKLANVIHGLDSVGGVVRFVNHETDSDAKERAGLLHLHREYPLDRSPLPRRIGRLPVRRDDGWMEIELGDFYNNEGDDGEVEACLLEIWRLHHKSGLIVEGIEFRPKTSFDHNILLHGGKVNFFLDEKSGTKCLMIGARKLMIVWAESPEYWEWASDGESRFLEVAKLKTVYWLDIRCSIRTKMLLRKTTYGAYLVFKLAESVYGLESAGGVVRFVNHEVLLDAEERSSLLHLHQGYTMDGSPLPRQAGRLAVKRYDGWMEIELGDFYNKDGDDGEVEARLLETSRFHEKSGLIVERVEFRPKTSSANITMTMRT